MGLEVTLEPRSVERSVPFGLLFAALFDRAGFEVVVILAPGVPSIDGPFGPFGERSGVFLPGVHGFDSQTESNSDGVEVDTKCLIFSTSFFRLSAIQIVSL